MGGLREMAQTFDGLSGAMERSGSQFGALPAGLSSWQGTASVNFASSAFQSRLAAIQAGQGFSLKARAARTYAVELEDAQRDSQAAIEDAREAERLIDRAKELIEDAQQRLDSARARAALADLEILATGLTGPPSGGAVAAKAQAEDEAEQATADLARGRKLLERGKDDLENARQRGNRAEERAETAGSQAQGLFVSATPAPTLPILGGPASGIAGNPASPLWGLPALTPINQLGGAGGSPSGASPFGPLPLLPLNPALLSPKNQSRVLQGTSGGLNRYGKVAGENNRMLRSFHSRGLGSLGDAGFSPYLLSPEALAQQQRMRKYHSAELAKAQDAGDDISKLKTAGRFLGPAGDALGAKANADEGMPWLENALRTGGSWGGGALGAAGLGTACAPGGPVAVGGCGAGGAVLGGEGGDWLGGKAYDGLDWTYQNGIEPAGEKIGEGLEYGYEKGIRPIGEGLGKVGRYFP